MASQEENHNQNLSDIIHPSEKPEDIYHSSEELSSMKKELSSMKISDPIDLDDDELLADEENFDFDDYYPEEVEELPLSDAGDSSGGSSDYFPFDRVYLCYPLCLIRNNTHMENGNKIIMPATEAHWLLNDERITLPLLFEIQSKSNESVSHCGVVEFTGEVEKAVFLPEWMMKNMKLLEGDFVNLKNVTLEKGTRIKIQPHSSDFLRISDHKAMLEETLRNFCCLTQGDTIMISHESKDFYIDIIETSPASAICIIDVDCEVDFAPPLDYKPPEIPSELPSLGQPIDKPLKFTPFAAPNVSSVPKSRPVVFKSSSEAEPCKEKEESNDGLKFKPFTGRSRRLDENSCTESAAAAINGPAKSRELVFKRSTEIVKKQVNEQLISFKPFTGSSRRLDENSSQESAAANVSSLDPPLDYKPKSRPSVLESRTDQPAKE